MFQRAETTKKEADGGEKEGKTEVKAVNISQNRYHHARLVQANVNTVLKTVSYILFHPYINKNIV